MGISNKGFVWQSTLMDIRIGYKLGAAGDVQLEQGKEAMSPAVAEALEAIIPQLVEAAVKAALASAGIGAVGDLIDSDTVSDLFGDDDDDDENDEHESDSGSSESKKKPGPRRTPEEKEANRAERSNR
jgi:hypothetical protein